MAGTTNISRGYGVYIRGRFYSLGRLARQYDSDYGSNGSDRL